ncbi:MAG TPA: DUF2806 domain-containing protein [Thermodesulfobacteriota bacterium]
MLDKSAKACEKLIDVVSSGIGILYEPTRIKRKAKAEADASLIRVKGEIRTEEERAVAKTFAEKRELRRFKNLDNIIGAARDYLPDSVSETPVDADWAATFFNSSHDVSNEQMQELWAKILAGEVAEPGRYSLKTLEVLKNLRQKDAEIFSAACKYIAIYHHGLAVPAGLDVMKFIKMKNLDYNEFRLLSDLNLIHFAEHSYSFEKGKSILVEYGGQKYELSLPDKFFVTGGFSLDLPPRLLFSDLTIAGRELYKLCDTKPDEEFRHFLVDHWTKQGIIINKKNNDDSKRVQG